MDISDIRKRGQAALKRSDSEHDGGRADLTLRLVTHVLRQDIIEKRALGRQWAQIAHELCNEFKIKCTDPKAKGRQVAQYHREQLSKRAEGKEHITVPRRRVVNIPVVNTTPKSPVSGVKETNVPGPIVNGFFSLK